MHNQGLTQENLTEAEAMQEEIKIFNESVLEANIRWLMDILPTGEENAISRTRLADILEMNDRAMRNLIEEARKSGHVICNFQNHKGYFKPANVEEVRKQKNTTRSRAMSLLRQLKAMNELERKLG